MICDGATYKQYYFSQPTRWHAPNSLIQLCFHSWHHSNSHSAIVFEHSIVLYRLSSSLGQASDPSSLGSAFAPFCSRRRPCATIALAKKTAESFILAAPKRQAVRTAAV